MSNKILIQIESGTKPYYERLVEIITGGKKGLSLQKLFVFAALYGFYQNMYRSKLEGKKDDLTRVEYIKKDPKLNTLLIMLAYLHLKKQYPEDYDQRIKQLTWDEIYTIAEGYASEGIKYLGSEIEHSDPDVFIEDLEYKLLQMVR